MNATHLFHNSAAALTLLLGCMLPTHSLAQAGLKLNTNDMANAVNKPITVTGIDSKAQSMAVSGQALANQPGKYGMMFLNAPIYQVYTDRLENNVDVMLSTLNDNYPLRKDLITQLISVASSLLYEYHGSVGPQTGQPKSMSQGAQDRFMKSITQSFTLGFYVDQFLALNDDYRILSFQSDLQQAVTASGEPAIANYNPNTMYMNDANSSDPSRGKDRIRDTAKDCVTLVLSRVKQTETLGTTGKPSGAVPNSDQVSKLFNQFNQIKAGNYWQLTKPGSSIGFYLKQLAGAAFASDVTSNDGTGDRYVDTSIVADGLPPFPSSLLLNMAKSIGSDFSGIAVATVPDPGKIQLPMGSSSGGDSSNGKKSNDPPAPPVVIH